MKLALAQLGAIMRYELKLHSRGKAIPAMMTALVGIFLLVGVLNKNELVARGPVKDETTIALGIMGVVGTVIYMLMVILVPVFVADTLPKDRQTGVAELLETTPLPNWVYLTGKILGVWLILLLGTGLALIVGGIWFWIILGPYDIRFCLIFLATNCLPIILLCSPLGVLIAAGQPTRRRAITVGVIISIISLFLMMTGGNQEIVANDSSLSASFWDMLNPARPVFLAQLIRVFAFASRPPSVQIDFQTINITSDSLFTILVGGAEIFILWVLAWLWLGQREIK